MSDPAESVIFEEHPLDDLPPSKLSLRRLLNIVTALALVVVLLIAAITNWGRFFPPRSYAGLNVYVALGNAIETLQEQTGKTRWMANQPTNLTVGTQGLLIGASPASTIFALDAATGAMRWQTSVDDQGQCIPLRLFTADGLIFVTCAAVQAPGIPSNYAWLMALDPATGAIRWRFHSHQATGLIVEVAGKDLLVGENNSENLPQMWLYAFDAATGVAQWRANLGGAIDDIAFDATLGVAVASSNDQYYGVALADGTLRWHRDINSISSMFVAHGRAYVLLFANDERNDTETLAVDVQTGMLVWQALTPPPMNENIVMTPYGIFLVDPTAATFSLLRLDTGRVQWRHPIANQADEIVAATPDLAILYAPTSITAWDVHTGTPRWHLATTADPALTRFVSITPVGDTLIIATFTNVYAVAAHDGAVRWHAVVAQVPATPLQVGS